MKFKKIENNTIIRLAMLNKNSIDIAQRAMNNEIYILTGLDYIVFKNEIDWNYKHYINSETYSLFLHTLHVIGCLSSSYEMTKDKKYIEKANNIMNSWINYEQSGDLNRMVWNDHATAFRIQNILHFYIVAKEVIDLDDKLYEKIINKHIDYLYDDKNYRMFNHGIMVDKSLLAITSVIDDENTELLRIKALGRLKENFYNNFSYKSVNLENSMYYHHFTRKLYEEIEEFLKSINLSLGSNILYRLKKSNEYFYYAVKPNGQLPLIGDSGKFIIGQKNKCFDDFDDYEAGIAYLQCEDKNNPINSTWLSFICGYSTKTHKHYDDLSLTLYYKGEDIFIDSGHFGYSNNKERNYIISQNAHTTFMIEDESYKLLKKEEAFDNIKITDFVSNQYYSMVKGKNTAYKDTQMYRTVILFKPDIIFIYDKGISKSEKVYKQLYNLSPDAHVQYLDNSRCIINDNIEILQISNNLTSEIYNADREIPIAVIAEKIQSLTDTSQVVFKKKCLCTNILTLISLDGSKDKIKNINFDEKNEILSVEINGIKHSMAM